MQLLSDISELVGGAGLAPVAVTQSVQGSSMSFGNGEVATQAIIEVGVVSAGLTGITVQIEESTNGTTGWTAIPNMVSSTITTGPSRQTLLGLRTQGYVRANVITASGTTVSALMSIEILAMPKASGGSGATGFSRSPSS